MIARITTIFLLFTYPMVAGASHEGLAEQQHLQQLNTDITQLNYEQQKATQMQFNLNEQLRLIDKKIDKLSLSLTLLNNKIRAQQASLQLLNQRKVQLQTSYKKQQLIVSEALHSQHYLQHTDPLKLILNQQDPMLIERCVYYLNVLTQTRLKQLKQLIALQHQLENNAQQHQAVLAALAKVKQLQIEQIRQITHEKHIQATLVTTLNQQIQSRHQQLSLLNTSKLGLENILKRVKHTNQRTAIATPMATNFAQYRRALPWPVSGRVYKSDEATHRNGINIATQSGRAVKAIFAGKVVFADWLQGYGMIIILQHDHNYLTLYGSNQALVAQVGQWVKQSDVIATTGRSGGQSTDGLYFEIRHKDQALSPMSWLNAKANA